MSEEIRAQVRQRDQEYVAQRHEIEHREEVLRHEEATEDNDEVLNQDLICQFEDDYDSGVIPNDQRRKFREIDNFFECEYCGALRMKK